MDPYVTTTDLSVEYVRSGEPLMRTTITIEVQKSRLLKPLSLAVIPQHLHSQQIINHEGATYYGNL
jgi:hypothetical protein